MSTNPWHDLPLKPPYILPDDAEPVSTFNGRSIPRDDRFVHLRKIPPEPFFVGANAPVVLLSNNPGLGKGARYKRERAFRARMRDNLLQRPSRYPFIYL